MNMDMGTNTDMAYYNNMGTARNLELMNFQAHHLKVRLRTEHQNTRILDQ